ncbi:MAG: vanadium-dependent haloperoxidase [Sarcina sp.]
MNNCKNHSNHNLNENSEILELFPSINPYGWNLIPYPCEYLFPQPEESQANSWRTSFLQKNENHFYGLSNTPLNFPIKEPDMIFNFKEEFDYIYNISKFLTPKEIEIAKYWGYGPPSKQLMPIVDILITTYKVPACRAQRILYILNGALNDACIVCWHYKYLFNVIRPVQYNPLFKPILQTPKHPSYPAGHAVLAGCMFAILTYFFPAEKEKLYDLALECSNSRLYAGVHYKADCDQGLTLGEFIGKTIIDIVDLDINNNHSKIDYQYTEFKDAPIFPDTSKQYI